MMTNTSLITQSPLEILLVEDDEDDYHIIKNILSQVEETTFHLDWVSDYDEATHRIQTHGYAIFLFDYRLGNHTGLDLVKYVRTIQCSTPCILLTGQDDHHVDVRAGESGAEDYLVKGELLASGLERSIRYALERHKAEKEREDLMDQLLETSRQLGRAEVAVNVLHNVGNVLNSINVSATQITTLLKNSYTNDIGRIASMIRAHQQDLGHFFTQDTKGQLIPSYLSELDKQVAKQHQTMLEEIQALTKNLDHLKHIVQAQQANTVGTNQKEPVILSELMEQALTINFGTLPQHQVSIVRDFADAPPIMSDKHQILQILVNLIRNAKHSMMAKPGISHCLSLTIDGTRTPNRVLLIVQDTGVGIKPQLLTKIFTQGFSTKQEGQGLGLHSSALAAQSLQGSLQAFSVGEGQGARFTLDLPYTPVEALIS
ncbi:ATP-binding protein [Candidatus Nitronereus thalassa]|uniref:histidine kinase n=1 Tax=Candidatus Nitronereus thalassa TaxID=3020898 RepID=A0ABU3KBF9_9BACT|nr:ATP-binding protein [Candidatus Nitronereus thalassa]MDT7043633.1 response regulator [Candidatus Nitronereus thalassa]